MQWSQSLSIGIKQIDDQHKKIFEMIGRLQESIEQDAPNREVGNVLRDLIEYTKEHFEDEERLMEENGFPGLEQHKRLHLSLVNDVKEILIELKIGKKVDGNYMITFLNKWLMDHILAEDLKFGSHLKNS